MHRLLINTVVSITMSIYIVGAGNSTAQTAPQAHISKYSLRKLCPKCIFGIRNTVFQFCVVKKRQILVCITIIDQ